MNFGINISPNNNTINNFASLHSEILSYIVESFSGVVAAYSIYQLSENTTNVIRVKRSSDNAEQDFTVSEIFDGTLESWVGAGNDGRVTTMYNQIGGSNHYTQTTDSNQPKIVVNGALVSDNGINAILLDAYNIHMNTTLTATGTMLLGGTDGSSFYEVDIDGDYKIKEEWYTHPENFTVQIIWNRTLSSTEKANIKSLFTTTTWGFSGVSDFGYYWRNRNELTSFPLLDVSNGTNFNDAWYRCRKLTSFPLLDVSNGTNFDDTWSGCSGLTSFPPLDVSSGDDFSSTWYGCTNLTSFPLLDVSNGTDFGQAWSYCSGLTSFPLLDLSNGTRFMYTWAHCSGLTSFPSVNLSSGSFFDYAWRGCNNLENFPANMFDSTTSINFNMAFYNTNLTQTSIDNILTSIDTAGQFNGTFTQSGGLAPSSVGEAAIDSLRGRGWTITVTGGY